MQGDRTQHGERGLVIIHAARHLGAQVLRCHDELCMAGIGDYAIADLEPGALGADRNDGADVAVAERQRRIELALDRLERGTETVRAHLLQRHPNFVGLLPRLVQQRSPA